MARKRKLVEVKCLARYWGRSVGSCSSAHSAPTGRTLSLLYPLPASLGLALATSVTHTPGVRAPTSRPRTIALCPCPSHHRLCSRRRHSLLAGSGSSALCGLSARGPGGSRGAGRARGPSGGGGATSQRGARPGQTESDNRARGAPPTGSPASDFG